jgi:hypothetical protein
LNQIVQDEVMKIIKGLSPEQIAVLKSMPRPESVQAGSPAVAGFGVRYTKSEILAKKLDDLRNMAMVAGIPHEGLKRPELAEAVFAKQEADAAAADVGVPAIEPQESVSAETVTMN